MQRAKSYISFTARQLPGHPIVKALRLAYSDKFDGSLVIYASHWATQAGWCIDGVWVGYTKPEAIKNIQSKQFI